MPDTTPTKIDLIAIYQLPASLAFAGECAGTTAPIRIAGRDGEVILPSVMWRGESPYLGEPPLPDVPERVHGLLMVDRSMPGEMIDWGGVQTSRSNRQEVTRFDVGALLVRFKVASAGIAYTEYRHGRGRPQGGAVKELFDEIDVWFAALSTWVRALVDQHVDAPVDATAVTIPADGLQVLTIEGDLVSLPAAAEHVIINMAEDEPLDMRRWTFALDLVSRGLEPPVEYPLVAAGRAAVRLKQLRRAVVDAGTAAELALTRLLDANYAGLTARVQVRLRSNNATLGWLVETVTNARHLPAPVLAVRGNLPATLATDLVVLRNDVIHKNKQPTLAEAAEAVRLARDTVTLIAPLPSPSP